MALTYEPIASQTLGSAAASVTFSNIPTTMTDLILICDFDVATAAQFDIRVGNGSVDTATNYSLTWLNGSGSAASSGRRTSLSNYYAFNGNGISAGTRTVITVNFLSYANTNVFKTALVTSANASSQGVQRDVMLWRSTSAINVLSIFTASSENYVAGSTFSLFGVKAA